MKSEAEKIILERSRMLLSIRRYLSEDDRKMILKRLEEEKRLLLGLVEAKKNSERAPEKGFVALNQIYFKRKTFDNNIFE